MWVARPKEPGLGPKEGAHLVGHHFQSEVASRSSKEEIHPQQLEALSKRGAPVRNCIFFKTGGSLIFLCLLVCCLMKNKLIQTGLAYCCLQASEKKECLPLIEYTFPPPRLHLSPPLPQPLKPFFREFPVPISASPHLNPAVCARVSNIF